METRDLVLFSVQSSDCNLVPSHSFQTLLLGHPSCIFVCFFSWWNFTPDSRSEYLWLSFGQLSWSEWLVKEWACVSKLPKTNKKSLWRLFFWGREDFYFYFATICKEMLTIISKEGEIPLRCTWVSRNEESLNLVGYLDPPVTAPELFHHLSQYILLFHNPVKLRFYLFVTVDSDEYKQIAESVVIM